MYLIGLTGNIASGKSTVRRFLRELGARTIDADAIAHAVLLKGTPGWRAVVGAFGQGILKPGGEVDRQKLGAIVFANPAQLRLLESIVHPAVSRQLGELLLVADAPVVVIEAIKLVEAGLHRFCDALWVVTTPEAEARRRLMHDRGLTEQEAEGRLRAQPPLERKLAQAAVVIDNGSSVERTRIQVLRAFAAIRPETATDKRGVIDALLGASASTPASPPSPPPAPAPQVPPAAPVRGTPPPPPPPPARAAAAPVAAVSVRRARPGDASLLATALAQAEGTAEPLARCEVLQRFGRWGYSLAEANGEAIALTAWKAENLVAIVRDLWARSPELAPTVFPPLLAEVEREANALECEVVLVITTPANAAALAPTLSACGYDPALPADLHPLWREAAGGEMGTDDTLHAKRLKSEIVTNPI